MIRPGPHSPNYQWFVGGLGATEGYAGLGPSAAHSPGRPQVVEEHRHETQDDQRDTCTVVAPLGQCRKYDPQHAKTSATKQMVTTALAVIDGFFMPSPKLRTKPGLAEPTSPTRPNKQ